jgi:hypothetical protein
LKKKETTFAYQKLDDHNRHVIWLDVCLSLSYYISLTLSVSIVVRRPFLFLYTHNSNPIM